MDRRWTWLAWLAAAGQACAQCAVTGRTQAPHVVELYTSEGCDSCPPVERWLGGFKGRDDVLALAFHVDYFDPLGWKDRFASPAHTRRQEEQLATNGGRFKHTPQVVVDGRDRKDFAGMDLAVPGPAAPVEVTLARGQGGAVTAHVRSLVAQPLSLLAFWAATEDGLSSQVTAGENAGATLHHDFVVRDYRKVAPWVLAPAQATQLAFEPSRRGANGPRDVALVISDASGKPMQAVRLPAACR